MCSPFCPGVEASRVGGIKDSQGWHLQRNQHRAGAVGAHMELPRVLEGQREAYGKRTMLSLVREGWGRGLCGRTPVAIMEEGCHQALK